jgi:hypothetical protein
LEVILGQKVYDLIVKSKLPTDVVLAGSDTGLIPPPKGGFNDNIVESDIRGNVIAK